MSLALLFNFNDQSVSPFYDLSGNGVESANEVGTLTTSASDVGYKLELAGDGYFSVSAQDGAAIGVLGSETFSITGKIKFTATGDHYVARSDDDIFLWYDYSELELVFGVGNTASVDYTVRVGVVHGEWIRFTATFDKAGTPQIALYVTAEDGTEDSATSSSFSGTRGPSGQPLFIGANRATMTVTMTGYIEEIRFYDDTLTAAEAALVNDLENDSGVLHTTKADHSFALGDLIVSDFNGDKEVRALITAVDTTTSFRMVPMSGSPDGSEVYVPCGNTINTSRQKSMILEYNGGDPKISVRQSASFDDFDNNDPVSSFDSTGQKVKQVTTTSNYTATNDDGVIIADNCTITLPSTLQAGKYLEFIKSGSNNITINPNGNNINGISSNRTYGGQYTSVKLYSNGTQWFIVNVQTPS